MTYSSTLEREAICSSKTLANYYQTTQNHNPEDSILQCTRNFKEYNVRRRSDRIPKKKILKYQTKKKKFGRTSETMESFVDFKFSL
jgi:hypothetical protein